MLHKFSERKLNFAAGKTYFVAFHKSQQSRFLRTFGWWYESVNLRDRPRNAAVEKDDGVSSADKALIGRLHSAERLLNRQRHQN